MLFRSEFSFPNLAHSAGKYIEHDNNEVVLFGSLQMIPEVVLITDKTKSVRQRHKALYSFLEKISNRAREMGFNQIHVFPSDDERWRNRLQKDGFKPTRYPAYVKEI